MLLLVKVSYKMNGIGYSSRLIKLVQGLYSSNSSKKRKNSR